MDFQPKHHGLFQGPGENAGVIDIGDNSSPGPSLTAWGRFFERASTSHRHCNLQTPI